MRPKYKVIPEPIIRDNGSSFYTGTTYVVKERAFYLFYVRLRYFADQHYAQSYCDALTEAWARRCKK